MTALAPERPPEAPPARLAPVLRYVAGGKPYLFVGPTNVILALDAVADDLVAGFGADARVAVAAAMGRHGREAALGALLELLAERVLAGPRPIPVAEAVPDRNLTGTGMDTVTDTDTATDTDNPLADHPVRTLVLSLAQGCNLACSYCFAGEAPAAPVVMSAESARAAVDFAFDQGEGHVHITFFGGEPLLAWPVLVEAVRYGEERGARERRSIDFSLTTNGSLLDDERIAYLAGHRVGVSISLDGPPDVHDRHRTRKGGKGSSEIVLPGVMRLLAGHRTRPIGARVTLASGNTDVVRIFEYLLDLGFHEVGFSPVTTASADLRLSPGELAAMLRGFRALADRTVALARKGRFLGFSNLINTWQELHAGRIKSHACGAGIGLMAASADGGLYLCQRFTDSPAHRLGDLGSGVDRRARAAFLAAAHVARKGACRDCWLAHTCAGGCYHEARERQGSALAPNSHYCEFMREWMELALVSYTELAESHPEFIARHVARRRQG